MYHEVLDLPLITKRQRIPLSGKPFFNSFRSSCTACTLSKLPRIYISSRRFFPRCILLWKNCFPSPAVPTGPNTQIAFREACDACKTHPLPRVEPSLRGNWSRKLSVLLSFRAICATCLKCNRSTIFRPQGLLESILDQGVVL